MGGLAEAFDLSCDLQQERDAHVNGLVIANEGVQLGESSLQVLHLIWSQSGILFVARLDIVQLALLQEANIADHQLLVKDFLALDWIKRDRLHMLQFRDDGVKYRDLLSE